MQPNNSKSGGHTLTNFCFAYYNIKSLWIRGILGFETWVGAPPTKFQGFFYLGGIPPSYSHKPRRHFICLHISKYIWVTGLVHHLHAPLSDYSFYTQGYMPLVTTLILIMIFNRLIPPFWGKCPPPLQNLVIFRLGGGVFWIGGIPHTKSPCLNPNQTIIKYIV